MKLLVTGGSGFIGVNFIRYWLSKYPKDQIVNLDKLTYAGNLSSTKDFEKNSNYKFIKGDICDSKTVDRVMVGIDTVVHFAAESHVDRSISGPQIFIKTNVLGTQVLLDHAIKHKVKRFHHISTDEVYGSLPLGTKEKFSEKTCYDPRSPYSASKAASDHLVRAYHETFGLPITLTNCSNNYGPYQHPEKFIPHMIVNLMHDQKLPIYGDGKYVRDWLHVEDHCRAIDLVLHKGKVGETYLIGGLTKDVNNLELVKKIIKIFGKSEKEFIEFVKDRPAHDRRYAVDWTKIRRELGWKPIYNFDEGLAQTISWYKENKWWWKPLEKETGAFYKKR